MLRLTVFVLSLLLAIPFPLASQLPTPVELNSFESEGDLCNLQVKNAEISLSAEHRTHGAHGLQIKFTGNGGATLQFRAPATPWDWSMYGGLGFDLMNLSDDEIGFALQIGDGVKTDETRNVGGAGTVGPRLTVSYLFPLGSLKYREDPWLIGYFVDNEISWGGMDNDREHYGLVYGTLNSDQNSPAKHSLEKQLIQKYGSVAKLNQAWGTQFASWEELFAQPFRPGVSLSSGMRQDFSAFLTAFAEQYFHVVRDSLKKIDSHHLYLGCRFAWRSPEAVEAAARYADVVSFNVYASHLDPQEWAFAAKLDKPCLIGEFHFGALDRGMSHTGLVMAPDQQTRAAMYRRYVESVADNPTFVGCHWFQYVDEPLTGRTYDGENYNIGFVDVTDTPYPEMVESARTVHRQIYSRHAK